MTHASPMHVRGWGRLASATHSLTAGRKAWVVYRAWVITLYRMQSYF